MDRRDFFCLLAFLPLAFGPGCKASHIRRSVAAGRHLAEGSVSGAATAAVPGTGVPGVDSLLRAQLKKMVDRLIQEWGDEKVPSDKEYVKYTDDYRTRAIINFANGEIRVETVEGKNRKEKLRTAIVHTLLTPEDPAQVDLTSAEQVKIGEKPFLYNLVLDRDGEPIRWEWRANQYAEYLMDNALREDTYNERRRMYVTFEMVGSHDKEQQKRYSDHVLRNSRRFDVSPDLIYSIIEVESSFNPYAMSPVPAYGLMQIVPETAGRDAYQLIHKRKGTPSRDYLFIPANNIRLGTAYLHLLDQKYLKEIKNPRSREYCVIAGYNTGSGNVLRSFAPDRERALKRINAMDSTQVYRHLVHNLPYAETRRYLPKVVRARRKYA